MNTISNERLGEIASGDSIRLITVSEAVAMARELLALSKQREAAVPAYYLNQIDYGDGEGFELKAYFRELDAMKSKDDFGGVVIPAYTSPPAQPDDEGQFVQYEDYAALENAVNALLADVKARYPSQDLYCPLMRELERLTK